MNFLFPPSRHFYDFSDEPDSPRCMILQVCCTLLHWYCRCCRLCRAGGLLLDSTLRAVINLYFTGSRVVERTWMRTVLSHTQPQLDSGKAKWDIEPIFGGPLVTLKPGWVTKLSQTRRSPGFTLISWRSGGSCWGHLLSIEHCSNQGEVIKLSQTNGFSGNISILVTSLGHLAHEHCSSQVEVIKLSKSWLYYDHSEVWRIWAIYFLLIIPQARCGF